MLKVLVVLTALVVGAGSSACCNTQCLDNTAPTELDAKVLRPIHEFVDGFNAGDTARAVAACTDEMSIIDEFPPYEWHGAGAISRWMQAYEANARQEEITDGVVTLGDIRQIDYVGEHAYVVASADYDFKLKGQPVREDDATMTFALQWSASGWRITGWAWSKN